MRSVPTMVWKKCIASPPRLEILLALKRLAEEMQQPPNLEMAVFVRGSKDDYVAQNSRSRLRVYTILRWVLAFQRSFQLS